jgi:hypothetical protein
MISGSVLILRNSVKSAFSHTNSIMLRESLKDIKIHAKKFKYEGRKAVEPGKHTDTEYFLYYKVNINDKIYYANVKLSNVQKREVLYCYTKHVEGMKSGLPPVDINIYKKVKPTKKK